MSVLSGDFLGGRRIRTLWECHKWRNCEGLNNVSLCNPQTQTVTWKLNLMGQISTKSSEMPSARSNQIPAASLSSSTVFCPVSCFLMWYFWHFVEDNFGIFSLIFLKCRIQQEIYCRCIFTSAHLLLVNETRTWYQRACRLKTERLNVLGSCILTAHCLTKVQGSSACLETASDS